MVIIIIMPKDECYPVGSGRLCRLHTLFFIARKWESQELTPILAKGCALQMPRSTSLLKERPWEAHPKDSGLVPGVPTTSITP